MFASRLRLPVSAISVDSTAILMRMGVHLMLDKFWSILLYLLTLFGIFLLGYFTGPILFP